MSNWKPKRFWKQATVAEAEDGWQVLLDGRQVRTPAKALLTVPTRALAAAIAAEWDAQTEQVDPNTMPVTRSANAAIDKLSIQREEVIDMLAEYGATDLVCYRAEAPAELVERQGAVWDPVLAWINGAFGTRLQAVQGVMFKEQPTESLALLRAKIAEFDSIELAAFYDLVAISGSLALAFAVTEQYLTAEDAWNTSRTDESWQEEKWGPDEEATETAALKQQAFLRAAKIFGMARDRT